MEATTLLTTLRAAGITLAVSGDKLHARAPSGTLTPERTAMIATHKRELMTLLVAEMDVAALERLDAALGDDGAKPESNDEQGGVASPLAVGAGQDDGYARFNRTAHRPLVPPGVCLDCGGPCPADGRHQCAACLAAASRKDDVHAA